MDENRIYDEVNKLLNKHTIKMQNWEDDMQERLHENLTTTMCDYKPIPDSIRAQIQRALILGGVFSMFAVLIIKFVI
jgi:hypothetical protein